MTTSPVVDSHELSQLGEQIGDPVTLQHFVDRYACMLDARVERLHVAWLDQDPEDWDDAALSLRTSSAMVGAAALAEMVGGVQESLKPHPPAAPTCRDQALNTIAALRQLAVETERQLRALFAQCDRRAQAYGPVTGTPTAR